MTGALSCELGVLWAPEGDRVAVCERDGFTLGAAPEDVAAAMRRLVAGGLPSCEQEAALAPLPGVLGHEDVRSWYALTIGGQEALGALLVCHTAAAPRGFTLLCQDLGARAADAAAGVLRAAALRDRLEQAAHSAQLQARQDGLTGLGNRLAWDEAAARCAEPLAVVFADVDGLKAVNDAHGHHAGDALLRAMADVLREATRGGDVVARMGGDEFAVLLPGADGLAVRAVVDRLGELLTTHPPVQGRRLSATIAAAVAPPQRGAEGALRAADAIVCAMKAQRTLGRAAPSAP